MHVFVRALALTAVFIGVCLVASPADAAKNKAKRKRFRNRGPAPATSAAWEKAVPVFAGAGRDPLPVAAAIDAQIDQRLAAAKIPASAQASDAEFLRRASLDIVGCIPSGERVASFLADRDPDKRSKLIDELLADPAYGRNFGVIWYHLLVVPNDDNLLALSRSFEDWLALQFNQNRPWDQVVSDILTAQGSRDAAPAATFWLAHLEGAKDPKLNPAEALGTAAQRFLGVQYQCAECHNHPFTGFQRADFWSLAAFLGETRLKSADKKSLKRGAVPVVLETAGNGMIEIPDTDGKRASAGFPDHSTFQPGGSLRAEFARWCTSPDNPAFARASVNRLWGHFFGRGIVDPIDDFRADNDASHPELLALLAAEFTAGGCDLKHAIRCICNSRCYQRSSDAVAENADDERLCSHQALKLMGPDVLLRSLASALGEQVAQDGRMGKAKNEKKSFRSPQGQFIALFDTADERDFSVDYSHGIPQVLRLMNGYQFENSPNLQRLQQAGGGAGKIVERLYLACLSRPPTQAELGKCRLHLAKAGNPAAGYADLMWALLNSSEFILNH